MKPAKCTNCGASITVDESKEAGICEYCGCAFITEKVINNITNNFNVQNATFNIQSPIQNNNNLKKLIKINIENGDYEKAINYCGEAMERDADDYEVFYLETIAEILKDNSILPIEKHGLNAIKILLSTDKSNTTAFNIIIRNYITIINNYFLINQNKFEICFYEEVFARNFWRAIDCCIKTNELIANTYLNANQQLDDLSLSSLLLLLKNNITYISEKCKNRICYLRDTGTKYRVELNTAERYKLLSVYNRYIERIKKHDVEYIAPEIETKNTDFLTKIGDCFSTKSEFNKLKQQVPAPLNLKLNDNLLELNDNKALLKDKLPKKTAPKTNTPIKEAVTTDSQAKEADAATKSEDTLNMHEENAKKEALTYNMSKVKSVLITIVSAILWGLFALNVICVLALLSSKLIGESLFFAIISVLIFLAIKRINRNVVNDKNNRK